MSKSTLNVWIFLTLYNDLMSLNKKAEKELKPTFEDDYGEFDEYGDQDSARFLLDDHSASIGQGLLEWADPSEMDSEILSQKWEEEVSGAPSSSTCPAKSQEPSLSVHETSQLLRKKKRTTYQSKNTPRFLVRALIQYLPIQPCLTPELSQKVAIQCQRLKEFHLQNQKKHIYLLRHLKLFLSDESSFTTQQSGVLRKAFHRVLRNHSLQMMEAPISQVDSHRIDYLRSTKIFSLRCRHVALTERNQCQ